MSKNTNILSYFKPFAQPLSSNKRSLPEDKVEEARAIRRSCSTTPRTGPSKEDHGRKGERSEQGLHRTSPQVTSRSVSGQPPDPWDKPMDDAEPAQAFRDETLHVPISPISRDPVSRNADVLSLQCTSSMSSQRVVKNGEVVIMNSDDDSDSESSLESLHDLLLFEGKNIPKEPACPTPQLLSSSPNMRSQDGRRMRIRRKMKAGTVAVPLHSDSAVQAKKYKFDLKSLVRHKKQEEASLEVFTRASTMLRSLEQRKDFAHEAAGIAGAASTARPLDATFIDVVMKDHGDEEELNRLKAVIRRTEALNHDKLWSFFDEQGREPLIEQSEFPCSEDDRLGRMVKKPSSRQQAFLGGYVREYATKERLPEEMTLWIMEAICLESRDDLRCSYTATLADASKDLNSTLSPERINWLFRKIGATVEALDIEGPVNPYPALSQSIEAVSRPNLSSLLDLFQNIASKLGAEARMHVICIICRLVLDHSVAKNYHVFSAIEDTLASLVESIPRQDLDTEVSEQKRQQWNQADMIFNQLQMVMSKAFKSITDAKLRLRLLQNLPGSCHRLILLRRRFALACFFHEIGYLSQHVNKKMDLKSIARHLEGPQFMVSKATDYSELTAAIRTLSIAVDRGDPPPSPRATEEERVFNSDIDALASKISSMFAGIVDTNASHRGRTEAKEELEAFQHWLSYGVRTKPPARNSLFGDSTLQSIADRHIMEAFVKKSKPNTPFVLPDSV